MKFSALDILFIAVLAHLLALALAPIYAAIASGIREIVSRRRARRLSVDMPRARIVYLGELNAPTYFRRGGKRRLEVIDV